MGIVGLFILLFATVLVVDCQSPRPQCKFTATNGFYAHVPSNLPIGDVVFRGSVSPPDAEMTIANVRSDAFKDTDWSDRLVIDRSDLSPGSYLVRLSASLALPVYPSTLKEANIFLTVICNGYAYPLFTVHIDSTNRFAPQFYHEPYVVQLDRNLPPWTIIETPVAAIDWDPADSYKLKFWLEDSHKGFELVDERKPSPGLISGSADWPVAQLPTLIRLKVTGAYDLPMSLRLIVSDGAKDARKSTTFVNLVERLGTGRVEPRTIPTTVTATTTTTSVPTTPTPTTTAVPEVIVDSEITKHEISVPEATTAIIDSEITKKPVQATSTTVTEHRTATTIPPEATINSEITKEPTTNAVTVPSSARTPTSPLPEPIIDSDITKEAVKSTTTTLPEVAIDSEITTTTTTTVTDSKTATSSLAEPIIDSEITTTTTTSFQTDLELIEKLKKSLQTLIPKKIQDDEDQLDAIAFAAKNREMNAIETENLDQIHSVEMENSPTRFTQCSLRTSIPENSVKGTKVAKLEVLNKRNTTKIRLIDPDDTFEIDKQSAEILVKDPKLVDRELFSTLELVAEIENADPSVQCSRIRVYVDLDDENDNRPVFENENYFFHIAKNFPPGREVGKFVAQDIDQGSNGQITYHLLTPDVPFQVGTQGKKGVLMSTGKLDDTIPMYNLIVEARDHGEEVVKSARVPVEVFVLGVKAKVVPTTTTMTTSTDGDDVEVVTEIVEVEMDGESESDNDVEVVTVIEEVVVEEEDLTTQKATTTEANQGSDVKEEEDVSTQNPTSRKEVTQGLDDGEEEATTLRSTTSKITQGVQEDEDEDDEEEKEEEEKGATTQRPTTSKVTQGLEDEEESNEEATKTHRSKTTSKPLESSEEEEEQEPTNTTKNPKRTSTTTKPPPPSEDNNQVDELDETEIETETTTPSPVPDVFSFRQPEYTYDALGMEIKENDLLGKVQAHPNPEFYAMDREVSGIIKINEMGEILAGKNLNRQADGAIKFGVSATNGFETARAQVTILRDANRDAMSTTPRFDQDTYRFEINENQQPEVIGFVRAFHSALSSSESVRLTYSLVAPAQIDELPFEIHQQSGEVSTSRPLDAEQKRFYRFQVRACLTQTICSASDVIVEVVDVNDNAPTMANRELEVTVESDVPPGTRIVKLYAKDADAGNNNRITFSIQPENSVFSIDPVTGQITTAQSLTQPLYTLLIDASDNGVPRRSDTAEVTVHVKGTNPSPPAFDQKEYTAVIAAPVRAGQVIGEVHATDPDPGAEGTVTYKLLRADNEDHRKFSINAKTGVISAIVPLAIQDGPISLIIEAVDNGKNMKRRVKTSMKIDIVNSETLTFLPLPTTVYISSEKAVGSVILRVSAMSTQNENIKFRALQDNSQFVMDGDLLRVANHLIEGESVLSIRAETDTAHVDHQLKVIVMADRDKYPVFPQLTYDFDVSTDGHFPRVVHQFTAKLSNGNIRYTFYPPTPPQGFYLDEKTGELFVTSQFPAKTRETSFVVIRAVNLAANNFYSDVGVAITPVSSTNPTLRFQQPTYNFEVYENLEQGDPIGTISVSGSTNSACQFTLTPDDSFLGIHQNGTLYLAQKVDAEEMEDQLNQEFTVTAQSLENSKETAKARIQVAIRDVNEFQPKFDEDEIEFSVDANAVPGFRIGRVFAHDKDVTEKNKLTYRVVGGSGRKLVYIQEDGTVIVGDEKISDDLDSFDLIIEAVDRNGNHDSTHVVVYVDGGSDPSSSSSSSSESNSSPPLFLGQPLVWNVTEGTTQTFELKATATAGSTIHFKIVGGDPDGNFDIVHLPEENTARLRIVSELDRVRQKIYTLQVEAKDERSQQTSMGEVTVNVLDGNSHAPMFTKDEYSGTLPMDIPMGMPIVTIEATDIDRDPVQFSLQGESCESQFSIDKGGKVAYKVPVSQRTDGNVVCVVVASDGEHQTDTTLRLSVKPGARGTESPSPNHAPTFSHPEFNFAVEPTAKSVGTVKATDSDDDRIEYSIEPVEYRNIFRVDNNGLITILAELEQPKYSFLVVAEDRGEPVMSSFTNVKVMVMPPEEVITPSPSTTTTTTTTTELPIEAQQDNEVTLGTKAPLGRSRTVEPVTKAPLEFSQPVYSWRIEEGMPVGSIVGQIKMNQKDPQVQYSFISDEYLSIDPEGRVAVLKPLTSTINDVIIATKGGNILAETRVFVAVAESTSTTTTTTTTTTEAPTTTTTTQETTTTEAPPTLPPVLSTTERTYEPPNNTLAPVNSPPHHVTSSRVIPIAVTSSTNGKFSFEHPTYYAFSTEGNFGSGIDLEIKPSALSTVNSQGQAVQFFIEDTTTQMPFSLSPDGKLTILEADREKHSSYYFTIAAKAGSNQIARARMNLTILDVNDNYPVFEKHPEVFGVLRSTYVGSPIYQMHATDSDENSVVTYEVTPREYFSIDAREGMIRVLKDLRDAPEDLELVVSATDSGKPPLKSETTIQMRLFKEDVPQLPKDLPEMIVGTSMVPGTSLKQVVAGPTVSEKDKILYRLEDSVNGLFEIKDGGVLVLTRRPLDTEANKYHQLNVTAENSKGADWTVLPIYVEGRLSGTTTPPAPAAMSCQFAQKVYRAQVKENSQPRTSVVRVQAGCRDPNRKFRYAFHAPTQDFEIDSQSGQIYTSKPLDRETKSTYFLTVNVIEQNRMMAKRQSEAAIEQATAKLSPWQSLVVVTVFDENDNSPTFLHLLDDSTLSAVVDQNANLMTPVIHLQARDLDIYPETLKFGLEGDGSEYFYANASNGLVQLTKSLEKSGIDHFELHATVTDGEHLVKVPLNIYPLSVDTNVVQLTKDTPPGEINPSAIESKLTEVLGVDTRILVAQPYVGDDGVTDPKKSHVFVYALEDTDRKPMSRDDLKELLMSHPDGLHPLEISSVSLLSTGSAGPQTLLTVILLIVLIALLLFICALIAFCAKRRSRSNPISMEGSYMVNSVGSGPRPYDVENISRTTAQTVLAGRPLPDPQEHRIEMSSDIALERDDTTREFSNSIRERPSLLQSAIQRQKITTIHPPSTPGDDLKM